MTQIDPTLNPILEIIAAHLDIPRSYYEKASLRHRAIGEWLHRKGSLVAQYAPHVHPQGSFRYGTVTPPLNKADDYDLDNVCVLRSLATSAITQEQLKRIYGEELRLYAEAHGMAKPPEEHNRCWRLRYADEVNFHLDSLPCVPDDGAIVRRLLEEGIPTELAQRAVAITDRNHPDYRIITGKWPRSNPRGFARWFESRAALGRALWLREKRLTASIEDVPAYEWKTTLQRSVQILKRHRDVMFRTQPALAPISMIITNLAAQAYGGESDLAIALMNILERMGSFVRAEKPRVPNPAYPLEDYADKWSRDPQLEQNFWLWHSSARRDIARLATAVRNRTVAHEARTLFQIEITQNDLQSLERSTRGSTQSPPAAAAPLVVPSAPKPWGGSGRIGT